MPDIVNLSTRSRMMSGIQGANTKPELMLRSALHRMGFGFRLHDRKIPGRPDFVLPRYRAVVMVNGCFWHVHECSLFKWPSTRPEFWRNKLLSNKERDVKNQKIREREGWRSLTVWECATKGPGKLNESELIEWVANWLVSGNAGQEISASSDLSKNSITLYFNPALPSFQQLILKEFVVFLTKMVGADHGFGR